MSREQEATRVEVPDELRRLLRPIPMWCGLTPTFVGTAVGCTILAATAAGAQWMTGTEFLAPVASLFHWGGWIAGAFMIVIAFGTAARNKAAAESAHIQSALDAAAKFLLSTGRLTRVTHRQHNHPPLTRWLWGRPGDGQDDDAVPRPVAEWYAVAGIDQNGKGVVYQMIADRHGLRLLSDVTYAAPRGYM